MKKQLKRDGNWFFDETTGTSFDSGCFNQKQKKLTKNQIEIYLADLGSGSETELESAKSLYDNYQWSPKLLDWIIKYCENESNNNNYEIFTNAFHYYDDERLFPLLLKLARNVSDEGFGWFVEHLTRYGGQEVRQLLNERFDKLSNNPKCFIWDKNNDDGIELSLWRICEGLFTLEPDNKEVAQCLVKLTKHPARHIKHWAIQSIVRLWHNGNQVYLNTNKMFLERIKELSKTNNAETFGELIPYLFTFEPHKNYEKFKKLYLKTKKEFRFYYLAAPLMNPHNDNLYWIAKLVGELPESETEEFRNYLTSKLVMPLSYENLVEEIRNLTNVESPNLRFSVIDKLWNLKNEDAQKILEEALLDEPDELIRKEFEKRLRKLKKEV